jgi:hypothetical protein
MKSMAFFPSVCMKNAEIEFNFGEKSFSFPPVSLKKINNDYILRFPSKIFFLN